MKRERERGEKASKRAETEGLRQRGQEEREEGMDGEKKKGNYTAFRGN